MFWFTLSVQWRMSLHHRCASTKQSKADTHSHICIYTPNILRYEHTATIGSLWWFPFRENRWFHQHENGMYPIANYWLELFDGTIPRISRSEQQAHWWSSIGYNDSETVAMGHIWNTANNVSEEHYVWLFNQVFSNDGKDLSSWENIRSTNTKDRRENQIEMIAQEWNASSAQRFCNILKTEYLCLFCMQAVCIRESLLLWLSHAKQFPFFRDSPEMISLEIYRVAQMEDLLWRSKQKR